MLSAGIQFRFLGLAHLAAIALTVIMPLAIWAVARRIAVERATRFIGWCLAAMLLANEAGRWLHGLATVSRQEFLADFLPLHICGAAVFLTALALLTRSAIAYETAYFWGLAGTVQAILTPDLKAGFPSYEFVQYFVAHSGIVTGVLFATWAMKMRPTPGSVLRTIIITHVFAAAIAGADALFGGNYMFLCGPPDVPTFFFFLRWPWYIVFLDAVGVIFIILLYLPFPLADALRRHRARAACGT
jgi:hypothetical integral membrane protein (TIGR02206 family)